jgi:hypothetical protein
MFSRPSIFFLDTYVYAPQQVYTAKPITDILEEIIAFFDPVERRLFERARPHSFDTVRYTEEWTNKFLYLDPGNRSRIKRTGR